MESLPGLIWVLTLLYLFQLSELLLTEFHQLTLSDLRQLCLSQATEFLVSLKTHVNRQESTCFRDTLLLTEEYFAVALMEAYLALAYNIGVIGIAKHGGKHFIDLTAILYCII